MNEAQKQTIAEAEQQLAAAYHMSISYGLRADELTNWKRLLDFISLGVGPGIILIVADKPYLRQIGITLAGLCSIAAYIWIVFGCSFQWDVQKDTSRKTSSSSRDFYNRLRKLLAEIEDSNITENRRRQLLTAVEETLREFEQLIVRVEEASVRMKSWMTLIAQQQTMMELGTSCSVCEKYWDKAVHKPLFIADAKRFCKKPNQAACRACGLALS